MGRRDLHGRAFRDVAVHIGKGQFHGFNLQVLAVYAVQRQAGDVKVLQDAQGDLRRDALPVRRNFMQRVASVVFSQRRDPFGAVSSEVGGRHGTAVVTRMRCCGSGNFALIKRRAFGFSNQTQRLRSRRKLKQLAHIRRAAVRHECLRKAGQLTQDGRGRRPLLLHHHRHAVAALGDFDGTLQQVGKRQFAEAFAQGHPTGHSTGHGGAVPTAQGQVGGVSAVLALEVVGRPRRRRAARRIQAVQLMAVPQNAKRVRPQAVADRLNNGHGGCGGNGRIDRVAAVLQHAQTGLRGQRVRGAHHVAAKHRQALAGVAVGVVEVVGTHVK